MSIIYSAICVADLLEPDGRVDTLFAERLATEGIKITEPVMVTRWPKPQEIVNAIVQLERYSVSANHELKGDNYTVYIDVDGLQEGLPSWDISLVVTGSPSTQSAQQRKDRNIYSSKDIRGFQMYKWPEEDVIAMSQQLASLCGPLLVVEDSGIVALAEPDGSVQESKRA